MPSDKTPAGFPNYFEMLQGMMQPFAQGGAPAFPHFPVLDPKELERKISEMETILVWLKAQSSAVELSVETMRVQLQWLKEMQNKPEAESAKAPSAEEVAKMAGAFNPAMWAWNMMQQQATDPPAKKPQAARKSTKRTSR